MSAGGAIPAGKLPAELLARLLEATAPLPSEIQIGPAIGEDAAAIDLAPGSLVVATDPITLTGSDVGAYAVVINANDVAVTGARPRWFLATVLLPEGTTEAEVLSLFDGLQEALRRYAVTMIGGHTEITPAVTQPVVVGQMIGLTDRPVPTGGARVGDVVIQAGPAPVEGAAVLAVEARDRLGGLEQAVLQAAIDALDDPGISVVEPALAAAQAGASSLHDPTEGGLAAALNEVATAAGVHLEIDGDAVTWFGPGLAVCDALGADPWATLASGTLLATASEDDADRVLAAIRQTDVEPTAIGRVTAADGSPAVRRTDGTTIETPARDEIARVLGE